jgi:hypothetical protein
VPETEPFATYLSHSWRDADRGLNLRIWEAIADRCCLLVDHRPSKGQSAPWYINRIEEYIRRSDLFVAVLAYRDGLPTPATGPDGQSRCS